VRVHPDLLASQGLPEKRLGKHIWRRRLEDIAGFEHYLARQGMVILKFFLHVSRDEQRRRLLGRLDEPNKNWKFNAGDVAEREHWNSYMEAYEAAIRATATKHAPWFVVPADHKWFARLVVVAAMIDALEQLGLKTPVLSSSARAGLAAAREQLLKDS
jgi:polyphosphate kinase 2 (PPK2 family)